jgi:hypothetical protein
VRLKCDGTRAETRFRLSAKRTSPFKSVGASVQSTSDSRDVRISGSNAGYTIFRGSFASFPFTSPPLRHRVPSRFNWTLTGLQSHETRQLERISGGSENSVVRNLRVVVVGRVFVKTSPV